MGVGPSNAARSTIWLEREGHVPECNNQTAMLANCRLCAPRTQPIIDCEIPLFATVVLDIEVRVLAQGNVVIGRGHGSQHCSGWWGGTV